jgi:hypothetical protein|tara:strand:- start:746 stop:1540 length:795 start_codon:yes stop_codon:yes gene_type:complete
MSNCNDTRSTCTPADVFAAVGGTVCGQVVDPAVLEAEQLVFDMAYGDLINSRGLAINYYVNGFNLSAADLLYGEHPTKNFGTPFDIQMYVELSEDALQLTQFGYDPGDDFVGYVHITTFTTTASAAYDYSAVGQDIEPKAGDVISIPSLGCDRPNGRGGRLYEISERVDQDVSSINPVLGHYVYRLRAKRFDYSFENGLSGEDVNEQVFDNAFAGTLSSTLIGQLSSAGKTYPTEEDPFDVDDLSRDDVQDMNINNNDIYGSYY